MAQILMENYPLNSSPVEEDPSGNISTNKKPIVKNSGGRNAEQGRPEFKYFFKAVKKHLLQSNHVKIVVLPTLLLMVVSNWAEMEIPEHAKDIAACFDAQDPAFFGRTLRNVIAFTLVHYTIAWIYNLFFYRELYAIKALLLCQCTEEYLDAEYDEYHSLGTGHIMTLVSRQTDAMARLLTIAVIDVGYDLIFFLFCLRKIYVKLGFLFFIAFIKIFCVLLLFIVFSSAILRYKKAIFNRFENTAFNKMTDIIKNYTVIKSFNNEKREIGGYGKALNGYVRSGRSYEMSLRTFTYFFRLIIFFVYLALVFACFNGVGISRMTGVGILLFQEIFSLFKKRIMKIKTVCFDMNECYADITTCEVSREKMAASRRETPALGGASEGSIENTQVNNPSLLGDLTIDFVDVEILQNSLVLFKNFNLRILPGEKIAVTGRNGSGKSTIIKTLMGFGGYNGDILIEGVQISSINEKALRNLISYVPQEPHLLDTTVLENLCYGAGDKDEEEVVKMCMRCGLHDLFSNLSDGYQTKIGENGRRLSGGQCQLINFMRAVVKDAPIIVLDEPTSNLDFTASQELLAIIFDFLRDKTVILSTHNPHHLSRFDKIINIKHHRIDVYDSVDAFKRSCGENLYL